ncbi:response regulator transcription factor [Mucilaginibacter paludis]|uniref:Two component transcriptional regulator, winged helix family n=1 Tax=Mucilaginibacter paludis DSM 18603 TaxID=714943 RepID=H1YBK2_9SPHI|nr:response regulator transcription factor [Mucilaginibacter paludis]EHQ25073.1 two component transcriptional regulator, winged helix family [Mucilaginibacter paludis DSM 18603]
MDKLNLLLVEDEPFLARVVQDSLEQLGYSVVHAPDGRKAFSLFHNQFFDLCIIDVMLPYTDGFTLVKQIRSSGSQVPVLFLTAKTATNDLIEGYQSGGNDYLKKPFSLEELFLRINELLKRAKPPHSAFETQSAIGKYVFVPHQQLLKFGSEEHRLSHRETQLLKLLYDHRNALLERKQALITLWGDDSFFNTRTMDVFINKLRKHLQHDTAVQIINVRGIGYKLIC